ncbi:class I SAM-dependent methyltransferase [Rheinheimera salexigens]|uniref:Methyltransferase n=1 Tax=Rheinheimera salexigens TaxID=1628148 RepID=A0A1E7Q2H8_9GAMM|nr:class I SAM-dependent methyltransferase [Rheinheimera salexigens]OEY68385.1 methyltransferase [Rheinheimera salexigens]
MPNQHCPLCQENTHFFCQDKLRCYWQCNCCALVFADRTTLLSATDELKHYQCHDNDINDIGYRQFLQRLAQPLQQHLGRSNLTGLDYGCGPGPLLAKILQQQGHHMAIWDPYFATDKQVLSHQYDFITCTEAIEHFVQPAIEWQKWQNLLKPSGVIAIMTKRYTTLEQFQNWHYKTDPTHVSFFSKHTFSFLAKRDGYKLHFPVNDVVIMQRTKH